MNRTVQPMDFDELLSKAEAVPTPTRKARVCIDPEVAKKRAKLLKRVQDARLEDARAKTDNSRLGGAELTSTEHTDAATAELEAFDSEVVKALVTLKFTRMDGDEWALLTSAFPMRYDVAVDRNYGYNIDEVSGAAARRSGVRIDDDGEHQLTEEQWTRMFKVLSGHDVEKIRDTVWTLNEYEPSQHVEALVKDFGAA